MPLPLAAVFQPANVNPVLVNPAPELSAKVPDADPLVMTAVGTVPVAVFVLYVIVLFHCAYRVISPGDE